MHLSTPSAVHIRELRRLDLLEDAARDRLAAPAGQPGLGRLRGELKAIRSTGVAALLFWLARAFGRPTGWLPAAKRRASSVLG